MRRQKKKDDKLRFTVLQLNKNLDISIASILNQLERVQKSYKNEKKQLISIGTKRLIQMKTMIHKNQRKSEKTMEHFERIVIHEQNYGKRTAEMEESRESYESDEEDSYEHVNIQQGKLHRNEQFEDDEEEDDEEDDEEEYEDEEEDDEYEDEEEDLHSYQKHSMKRGYPKYKKKFVKKLSAKR